MAAVNEVARLKRDVESLKDAIATDLRHGSKSPMSTKDRRAVKSEIEHCMQELDELRTRLTS